MFHRFVISFLSALVALSSLLQFQAAAEAALQGAQAVVKHDTQGCPMHRCRLGNGHEFVRLLPTVNKSLLAIAGLPQTAGCSLAILDRGVASATGIHAGALHTFCVKLQV
jgi:hypothetical protein